MKKLVTISLLIIAVFFLNVSFKKNNDPNSYFSAYSKKLQIFKEQSSYLVETIKNNDLTTTAGIEKVTAGINEVRKYLKGMDFWLRYLEPSVYKKVNGPLPVEWETEVFEKFERPYRKEGAGLTLATLYTEGSR